MIANLNFMKLPQFSDKERQEHQRLYPVAISILNYLLDHPKAKDTLKGVAKWWVGEEEKVVKEALFFLQKEGVIEKKGELYQLTQITPGQADNIGIEKILLRLKERK